MEWNIFGRTCFTCKRQRKDNDSPFPLVGSHVYLNGAGWRNILRIWSHTAALVWLKVIRNQQWPPFNRQPVQAVLKCHCKCKRTQGALGVRRHCNAYLSFAGGGGYPVPVCLHHRLLSRCELHYVGWVLLHWERRVSFRGSGDELKAWV